MNLELIGLCAYTDKKSYFSNDDIKVYVNYENKEIQWSLLNKYGNSLKQGTVKTMPQNYYPNAFAKGCHWNETIKINLNNNYPSDVYLIKLFDNLTKKVWYCEFILKNKNPKSKILVLNNMNTKEAYNYWGGLDGNISLYKWNISPPSINSTIDNFTNYSNRSNIVSFLRPSSVSESVNDWNFDLNKNYFQPTIIAEIYGLIWLDKNGYSYDIITDLDLNESPNILKNYPVFLNFGHNEYWTIKMVEGLRSFILDGGNFMNLGGNSLYWKSTLKNNQLEVRKDFDIHTHDNTLGGLFHNLDYQLNTSIYNLLGAYYFGGFDEDNSYSYKITKKNHWIFDNVNDSIIGTSNKNSNDGMKNIGPSGYEVDILTIDKKYTIAEAYHTEEDITNHLIYYENNGKVFNAGSIVFSGSLLTDKNISQMTKNVLNNFISNKISDSNYKFNWPKTSKFLGFKTKSENMLESDVWLKNKDVTINKINSKSFKVTSNISTSTPGIYCDLNVKSNSYYNLKINGYKIEKKYKVVPYIRSDNGEIIWKSSDNSNLVDAKSIQLLTNKTPIDFTIKIPKNISRIRLYLLFYKVSEGDLMYINSISFNEMSVFNGWIKNQDVDISFNDNSLIVVSNKNYSTPGIKFDKIVSLKPNSKYEYKIIGSKKSNDYNVRPYIIDNDTNEKIHLMEKYILSKNKNQLETIDTNIIIKFKTLDKAINAKFYVLFNYPKIGSEFIINSIEINEIINNQEQSEFVNVTKLSNWIKNQDVDISFNDNSLIAISNKNSSTPGIKFNDILELEPNTEYIYNIIGFKKSGPFKVIPLIIDSDSSEKLYPNNKYLVSIDNKQLKLNETKINIRFKTLDNKANVKLYVLFYYPTIGAEFIIKSIKFNKLLANITNLSNWINNQDVTINNFNDYILIESNQNTSTPGIRFNEIINLNKNEIYQYKIIGKKSSDDFRVLPCIIDVNTKDKIYPSNVNLISSTNKELNTNDTEISLLIKMPEYNPTVKLYLLFSKPYISAKFNVKSIEFNKLTINDITYSFYKNKSHNNNFVAYTEKKSYYPNDTINIYTSVNSKIVNNNVKTVTYSLVDINKKILITKESTNLNYQEYPNLGCIYGCNWNISESIKLPNNLKSGMYILCARCNNNVWFIPIVIKNNSIRSKILVLSNINTWNAYEYWAGYNNDMISAYKWQTNIINDNKYLEDGTYKSYRISFNRPSILISKDGQKFIDNNINSYVTYSHLFYSELWMYKFLDNNSIEYDLINDMDLNNNEGVNENYKLFIIHSHPEYWTENALINLNKMTQAGTNIAYFGGNGFYWKTTYKNNIMEVRKDKTNHDQDGKKGGLWINLQLPNNYLIGPDLFGVWYNEFKFDKITLWPFNKTKNNYLLDNIEYEFGDESLSSVKDDDGGISGWEVDDVLSTYNKKYKDNIIASAKNGADMLYIEEDNYKIFSGSTILWTAGLLVDDNIKKLTLNVISSFSK
jgi:hypothetical protein